MRRILLSVQSFKWSGCRRHTARCSIKWRILAAVNCIMQHHRRCGYKSDVLTYKRRTLFLSCTFDTINTYIYIDDIPPSYQMQYPHFIWQPCDVRVWRNDEVLASNSFWTLWIALIYAVIVAIFYRPSQKVYSYKWHGEFSTRHHGEDNKYSGYWQSFLHTIITLNIMKCENCKQCLAQW